MLIYVYIVGFILGGLVFFATARRIPNRRVKIILRTIGVIAGPVFFLALAIFSGWECERTYQMEWLIGEPAVDYAHLIRVEYPDGVGKITKTPFSTDPITKKQEEYVVLKRNIGDGYECYDVFASNALAHYLEGQPTQSVKVHYTVTYDFFQPRGYRPKRIDDFGHEAPAQVDVVIGWAGGGQKSPVNSALRSCFTW